MKKTVWDVILPSCPKCGTKVDFIAECFEVYTSIQSYARWQTGCSPSCGCVFGGKIGKVDPETGYFVFFLDRNFICNEQDFLEEDVKRMKVAWERNLKRWMTT